MLRTALRPVLTVASLVVTPACAIESHNVNIGQVPRATVPFANTAPTSAFTLTAGVSALPTVATPERTDDRSGAEVPAAQGRGELIIRPKKDLYVGVAYEQGFGHQAVDADLPTVHQGNVHGAGFLVGGTLFADPSSNFSLGTNLTAMCWTVPYDQYSTVTVDVLGHVSVGQSTRSTTDTTCTLGLGLWPSYRFGELRVFGGGYLTQRPTVHMYTTDVIGAVDGSGIAQVIDNDSIDFVLAVGAEYELSRDLALTAIINQEALGSTMRTGPTLQLAVSLRLGEHASDRSPATTSSTHGQPPGLR